MKDHAILQCYGMLVHVSAGYLPVRGWLHTCYSPVRRSPPVYCYTVLPLDLHVLSLSLAFILSQDQTLHGKVIYRNFCSGRVMCFMNLDYRRFRFTLATLFIFTSILLKNSSCHFHRPRFFRSESGCKDKAFLSFLPNLFRSFFKLFFEGLVQGTSRRQRSSSTPPERHLHVNSTPSFILPCPVLAGAKIRQTFTLFQTFQPLFFKLFQSTLEFRLL